MIASPLAGWMSDRYDRRALCLIADFVRFLAALALGAIVIAPDLHWAIWLSTIPFAAFDRIALRRGINDTIRWRWFSPVDSKLHGEFLDAIRKEKAALQAAVTGVLLYVCTPTFTLAAIAAAFAISVCCMCLVRREPLSLQDARNTNESKLLIDRHLLRLGAIYAFVPGGMLVSVIGPTLDL